MEVLSNPSSARLSPYLILFVLIPRHAVLSTPWHTMGETQSKLSLKLKRGHSEYSMLEKISSCSSSTSGSSHHSVRCLDVSRRKGKQKKMISAMLLSVHALIPHCHHNHTQRDKIPSYLLRVLFCLLSKDRNHFSDIRRFT